MSLRTAGILAARAGNPCFTDQEVAGEQIDTLLEAAMSAPNRLNRQPWHFILIRDKELHVSVIGTWKKGFRKPLWVMTNLASEEGFEIYRARMKTEESFRDLKSLLHLDKVVNKTQSNMEKMVTLLLIAYAIGLLVGESIRDHTYGSLEQVQAAHPAHQLLGL